MKILMRHGARKGASKSAIAIRLHYLPFKLQWKREEILKKIKSNQDKYGVTNQAVNFSKGKSKATIIYLDSFSDSIKEKLIASKCALHVALIYKLQLQLHTYVGSYK